MSKMRNLPRRPDPLEGPADQLPRVLVRRRPQEIAQLRRRPDLGDLPALQTRAEVLAQNFEFGKFRHWRSGYRMNGVLKRCLTRLDV